MLRLWNYPTSIHILNKFRVPRLQYLSIFFTTNFLFMEPDVVIIPKISAFSARSRRRRLLMMASFCRTTCRTTLDHITFRQTTAERTVKLM